MQWTWRFGALDNQRHARLLGLKHFGQWHPVAGNSGPDIVQWRASLTLPDLPPGHVIIPSFAMLGPMEYGFRFTLTHEAGQAQLAHIGASGAAAAAAVQGAGVDAPIDCFVTLATLRNVRIDLLLDAAAAPAADALLCVSCRPWQIVPGAGAQVNAAPISAPSLSQRELPERMQHSACSPVSVAMAMAALGHEVDAEAFADAAHHSAMYGVWPANLYAASRRGALGFVATFTHIDDAVVLLAAGMPVIASTRWHAGELTDGAIEQSGGHLILVRGFTAQHALVNDPAAATAAGVARSYQRDEFCRIWLRERGAAYVLLP